MATDVLMPQMGESIAEGTITKWLVSVGTEVERDQPLFEISTDKVDAEIPSPTAGVLIEILHHDGETVPVNQVVGRLGSAGETPAEASTSTTTAETTPTATAPVVAAGESAVAVAEADEAGEPGGPPSLAMRLRRHSSPVVRKIAAEHGIDLATVPGSGTHGRVTKKDILSFIESGGAAVAEETGQAVATQGVATQPTAPATPAARPAGDFAVAAYQPGERVDIQPMSRIRQLTAAHMTYSKATSAHVTTVFEIDMTQVDRLRQRAKSAFLADTGTKLTYMPFIFKAVSRALRRFPQLNAAIDGTDVVLKKDINIGMAVAMDRGLIVPVIKDADALSLVGLARKANDLADRARSKRLKPEEAQGGTFTVTNPGVFGSLFGTPIINQPQVAILSIGTIEKRPVVVTDDAGNDALAIRTMCYFAITFDHRLIDGADADHFMAMIKDTLQNNDWKEIEAYL